LRFCDSDLQKINLYRITLFTIVKNINRNCFQPLAFQERILFSKTKHLSVCFIEHGIEKIRN
jgi:hypothetical protein